MALLFSRRAVRDLEDIGDYIAQASPQRARSFVAELRRQCEKIAQAPLSYPARADLSPGLRVCPHGRYLILYRIEATGIRVLRIAHSARDIFSLF
jgi:toxin ParE1/3/4